MASTYLTRTSGTSTNAQKFTMSFWVKRSALSSTQMIFYSGTGGTAHADIDFASDDKLNIYERDASSVVWNLKTNRVFRDVGAWYHIVIEADSTQATSSDRIKLYVNGVQETSFGTETYPNLNISFETNKSSEVRNIGKYTTTPYYFDGSFAHFHFVDGTAYAASTFGETDSTTGIWKPKASPSVTYGTNGFFLKFENSGSMGTDSSGNTNNFTVNGTPTQTIDTPSNNFCTWNPLDNYYISSTYSNGNTTQSTNDTAYGYSKATLGASSGKWYWEIKVSATSGYSLIGIASSAATSTTSYLGSAANNYAYYSPTGVYYTAGSTTAYGNSYTTNDIIGVAMDLDNNKLYFAKNGVWQNSGDPTSGATGTGAISITDPASTTDGFYFPAASEFDNTASSVNTYQANFGNGYFGTTAVASAGTNAGGIGTFEYDVPSGYYALCTKQINTYG